MLVDVVSYLDLMFMKHPDEEGDVVGGLVIDDVEVVFEWVIEFVIEESVKFLTSLLKLFVATIVMDVLVCDLVGSSFLDLLNAFLACVETHVK